MSYTIQTKLYQSLKIHQNKIAIEYGENKITYSELDQQSNIIANWIRNSYNKASFIGVLMKNRSDFIIAMIGILKANCVFVPLEASFPQKRVAGMSKAIGLSVTICDNHTFDKFHGDNAVSIQTIKATSNDLRHKPNVDYFEEDAIYVYHTSGTTGNPKAIIGRNSSLLHFISWEIRTFNITDEFRFSQFTNVGFDVFLRDTLVALCTGAVLCIPEDSNIILNNVKLCKWIEDHRIQFIHCVPIIFEQLTKNDNTFNNLKYILLAGEKIRPHYLKIWYQLFGNRIQLVNLYGPTETTLAKAFYLIQPKDQHSSIIPIGKAIDGTQLIILNEEMKKCDTLEIGEVYIQTPFMSLGYFQNEKSNEERFITTTYDREFGEKMYKTGDLGRLLPDGNIELLGRIDRQLKIRGIRIESDEIEQVMMKHEIVKDALIVMKQLSDVTQVLYAYITLKDNITCDLKNEKIVQKLSSDLSEELPSYMIPGYIIVLDEIPRKINGKVDYDKLQDPLTNCIKSTT